MYVQLAKSLMFVHKRKKNSIINYDLNKSAKENIGKEEILLHCVISKTQPRTREGTNIETFI